MTDLARLKELSKTYDALENQMKDCSAEWERAQDLRLKHR